jgi:hypothetical protein
MRVELGTILLPVAAWAGLVWWWPSGMFHRIAAGSVVLTMCVLLLLVGGFRRRLASAWRRASIRRRLDGALVEVNIPSFRDRRLAVGKVARTPAGWSVRAVLPPGAASADLETACDRLAAAMRLHSVTMRRDPDGKDASRILLRLHAVDPFAGDTPLVWPLVDTPGCDVWEPVPVAVDEDGNPVALSLAWNHVLIAGLTGAGKSVIMSQIVAAAALDPRVRLHLLDGKLVELAAWRNVADATVGPDPQAAIDALRALVAVMEDRYRDLLAVGKRKIDPDDTAPLHLLVVDELAFYVATGDRNTDKTITALLRDLVARGRAAGVMVFAPFPGIGRANR